MLQLTLEHLFRRTHELSHRNLNLTNHIEFGSTLVVLVDHGEFEVLSLLEEIINFESRLEVRVQVVIDCFGVSDL